MSVESVFADAMSLPDDVKEELVERLVADLVARHGPDLERLHVENAIRRRDAMRAGAVRPIPGPEALRRAREALQK